MSFWALFLIALGVSADAFAVALGKGLHMTRFNARHAVVIAVTFGAFQALMPLLGWLLGSTFAQYIAPFDHWVAFGLLALIGGKMLYEAFSSSEDLPVSIGWAILLIGVTTTVLTFVGVLVGRRVGARFGKPAEIAGGVILILIGVNIVLEHTGVLG